MPQVKANRYETIALDTETTGLDFYHGCRPFVVTTFLPTGENRTWVWRVDPRTREVDVPSGDVKEIKTLLGRADRYVLHNSKFDYVALKTVGVELDWTKVDDTLIAGHILGSNLQKNLTAMALRYADLSIKHREVKLEQACKKARTMARSKFKGWKIARAGMEELPSCKGSGQKEKTDSRGSEKDSAWFFDSWLPRELAVALDYPDDHPWHTITEEYADDDSGATFLVWRTCKRLLQKLGYWKHYLARMELLPTVVEMEENGTTLSGKRVRKLIADYTRECDDLKQKCLSLSVDAGYEGLKVPEGNRNDSVEDFLFKHLNVRVVAKTETGKPALNKKAFDVYLTTLDKSSIPYQFFEALSLKSTRKTAVGYLEGYRKFWLAATEWGKNWFVLHPSFNPTGTNTIRFSSSNPNAQNVSKKKGFNLRYGYGPLPGREWWALDYENLELRIPAYEAGERAMIDLFENPDAPPYFGSYHMLVFSILHPEMWAKWGTKIKDSSCPDSAWYGYTKNGNFAVQYGAQESSGTADRAYHVKGAQRIIQDRFTNIKALNQRIISHANEHGFVYTMPRKNVDPTCGYPLLCEKTAWGKVVPTTPLSYHVQGTAMECTTSAMVRTNPALHEWTRKSGKLHFMTLQVHDEIVFDFPRGKRPDSNVGKVMELKRLMEMSGDDIGIPLKVSVSYHPDNWSESQEWSPAV